MPDDRAGALGPLAPSELILGGQKSGKSCRAEQLAHSWLASAAQRRALLVATAYAGDDEMRQRIARHRTDRALRCPALRTLEEPRALAHAIDMHSMADTLVIVDCLTLWLTQLLCPAHDGTALQPPDRWRVHADALLRAIGAARGPVVLVSNEIGLGVVPMGREVRGFVDALGSLNQSVAAACERVTLMTAGLALRLKGSA